MPAVVSSAGPGRADVGAVPAPAERVASIVDRGSVVHATVVAGRWSTRGVAKVLKDVDVVRAELDGLVAVGGRFAAENLRYRGTLGVGGAIDVRGTIDGRGTLTVGGALDAADLRLRGPVRLDGPLRVVRHAAVVGSLRTPSLLAGAFELDGSATVPGEVNAGFVRADFDDASELGSVVAPTVRLHGRLPNLLDKVFFRSVPVRVERVEADTVDLEAVDVEFVRAKTVVLGAGAHVTRLEATDVRRHPKSRVGPESVTPAPYGLRR